VWIGGDQLGFRRGKATRDAIGMITTIAERNLGIDNCVFAS